VIDREMGLAVEVSNPTNNWILIVG
jgi:hypothetical protein